MCRGAEKTMKKRLFAIMLCVALTSGCVYAESAVSTESTESTESNSDADSTESAVDIDSTVRTESVESTEGIEGDESAENAESTGSMQAEKEDGRETIGIISAMDTELKLLLEIMSTTSGTETIMSVSFAGCRLCSCVWESVR